VRGPATGRQYALYAAAPVQVVEARDAAAFADLLVPPGLGSPGGPRTPRFRSVSADLEAAISNGFQTSRLSLGEFERPPRFCVRPAGGSRDRARGF
jgi:hypothetical protein